MSLSWYEFLGLSPDQDVYRPAMGAALKNTPPVEMCRQLSRGAPYLEETPASCAAGPW